MVGAIEAQRRILVERRQPHAARRDALKFLVHFVGDVHQPMHANNRGDKGGNDFQISLRTDLPPEAYARVRYIDGVMGTNLHSVWDFYILGSQRLDLRQYAARLDALPWTVFPRAQTIAGQGSEKRDAESPADKKRFAIQPAAAKNTRSPISIFTHSSIA